MSDQQQENEITTTQAAPAAPVASDQVATPVPERASAPEAPKPAPAKPQTYVKDKDDPFANVGRNDPCPCGSGLKFKKCHGKDR